MSHRVLPELPSLAFGVVPFGMIRLSFRCTKAAISLEAPDSPLIHADNHAGGAGLRGLNAGLAEAGVERPGENVSITVTRLRPLKLRVTSEFSACA